MDMELHPSAQEAHSVAHFLQLSSRKLSKNSSVCQVPRATPHKKECSENQSVIK